MSCGVVYCITNAINDKKYIGITTRTIEQRFKEHKEADSYIGKAIRKHGVENFEIEIIDEALTKEELCDNEIYWIEKYNTFNEGYNLTRGGEGVINYIEIPINLSKRQKRFIEYVDRENKRVLDINNEQEVVTSTLINIVEIYLKAKMLSDKQRVAKLINKLKPSYKQFIEKINVINFNEVSNYL